MDDLTLDPVDELLEALVAAGLEASLDPSELNMPGAWVTVEQIIPAPVLDGGWQIDTVVYLVAPDQDHARAAAQLVELFNLVSGAGILPDGPVVPQGVIMPGDPTPLPGLRVPVSLFTPTI